MSDLSNPIFHDETKARQWLEARIWANGPICPKCGTVDEATLMQGESHRPGLYQCNACREPFTVTVGTLYERSKVPLHKWLAATHLMMASKKGMSALQVGRLLGLSKKTSWFLCHRIRESLRETDPGMLGGEALVERKGRVRSHHIPKVNAKNLAPILEAQLHGATVVYTDEGATSKGLGRLYEKHESVNHSIGEYVRGDVHTNTIESYFSILKRGINGTFHHQPTAFETLSGGI
jgi:transposase-like protein